MDLNALMEQLGGEIVLGRARVRHNGKIIVVGRNTPDGMIMTAEGKELADLLVNGEAPAPEAPVDPAPVDPDPVDPDPLAGLDGADPVDPDPVGLGDGDD